MTLRIDGERILLALPAPTFREPGADQVARVADALGISAREIRRAAIIDAGPVWFTLQLADGAAVLGLSPDMGKLSALNMPGVTGVNVFGLYPDATPADVEVRSFVPADGVPQDPVCGSGNGCVAALIQRDTVLPVSSYRANQGRRLERDGRVGIEFDGDGVIWLGGQAVTCIEGNLCTG